MGEYPHGIRLAMSWDPKLAIAKARAIWESRARLGPGPWPGPRNTQRIHRLDGPSTKQGENALEMRGAQHESPREFIGNAEGPTRITQRIHRKRGGPDTNQAENSSETRRAQHASSREFIGKRIQIHRKCIKTNQKCKFIPNKKPPSTSA